jgi:Protein of unknown function (DUF3631)
LIGPEWVQKVKDAAVTLSELNVNDLGIKTQLLADICAIFGDDAMPDTKLTSEDIVKELAAMEDRPWPEWGQQKKPISKRALASLLKPFDIEPKRVRIGDDTLRGYERQQFDDAFVRYLGFSSATPPQTTTDVGSSLFSKCHSQDSVADENDCNAQKTKECGGVADRNPESGGKDKCSRCGKAEATTSFKGAPLCGPCLTAVLEF